MDFIVEKERKTPVVLDVDVCVVGCGAAGVVAIASGRNKADTLLIEPFGTVDGCPTVGRTASIAQRFRDVHNNPFYSGNA